MSNDLFVDTSGWAEILDDELSLHTKANELAKECIKQQGKLITTDLVLVELTALLISPVRMPKNQQIPVPQQLRNDPTIKVVSMLSHLSEAWRLWESRQDKDWTMVDCASFVVMKEWKLLNALTSDHHFEQAGFVQLLK